MPYVYIVPETLTSAADILHSVGTAVSTAEIVAAAPTSAAACYADTEATNAANAS
jgi:hypothetical protein